MGAQYFAQIDENNIVTHIAVVQQEFLEANPDRYKGTWVETFMNAPNKTYAAVGYTYSYETEDFVAPVVEEPVGENNEII